ncbi:hypothetical protein LB503_002360 [Fusarium chuoi]|nr:hypothetical protein LB503_002360 [Fusarium chuoi]
MEKTEQTSLYGFDSHETALCVIPPRGLWPSVDRLRSLYDKAYSAWPPHINLIYPFVQPEVLGNAAQALEGLVIQDRAHLALNPQHCLSGFELRIYYNRALKDQGYNPQCSWPFT